MKKTILITPFLIVSLLVTDASSQENEIENLLQMNMRQLANVEVTTVSKKEESAAQAAAAIYVINSEDIRRSTATNVPELLRVVPGVQVSRTDSNRWRVSIRGFNDGFSNKLLVLIDGRSVYTPLFSGVYWDTQIPPLEDISQVEVIRGSAGSTWGANAVNGIINIITKSSSQTQGFKISALAGDFDRFAGYVRYGGKISDKGYYKVYAEHFDRSETQGVNGNGINDDWRISQTGFRVDYEQSPKSKITLQGDVYDGRKAGTFILPILTDPMGDASFTTIKDRKEDLFGGNILKTWIFKHENGGESVWKSYYDYTKRNNITLEQYITTLDTDYQYNWSFGKIHDLSVGVGARLISDNLKGTAYNRYDETYKTTHILSSFIQDKISIIPEKVLLTLGTKLEHNGYTAFEIQPTARLAWTPTPNQTLWAAASRSVRTPSRAERDIKLVVGNLAPGFITWNGNTDLKSEELYSVEGGYKATPTPQTSFDITGYMNIYENLRTFERGAAFVDSTNPFLPPHANFPLFADNKASGEVYGLEVTGGWNVTKNWSFTANYSLLQMFLHTDTDSSDAIFERDEGKSAEHQFNLVNKVDLPYNFELDNIVSYTDNLNFSSANVPAYIQFDTRVSWRPKNGIELSVVGKNLFDDKHPETSNPQFGQQSEIGRSFYGKLTVEF